MADDLKADLADAQKRELPEYGVGINSAIFNPQLEQCVSSCVGSLLEILHPSDGRGGKEGKEGKGDKKGKHGDKGGKPSAKRGGGGGGGGGDGGRDDDSIDSASASARTRADTESDTSSFGPRENKNGSLALPQSRKLRKGDSGNLRAMLLARRQNSVGRSSQELLTMISILDGNEDDADDAPDELVMCRLCEQQVLRSSLQLHTALCKATHKARHDDEKANKEVRELMGMLGSTRRQALLSLVTIAVQRFNLLCAPLDKLNDLGRQLLQNEDSERSPLHHLGRLTELARDLAMLKRAGGSELGGSVFYSCASQLKAIIADKIANVQELIDLDPHALDHGATRPLKKGTSFTGKLGIKDFTMIRMLATGGFASVCLSPSRRPPSALIPLMAPPFH